MTDEQLFRRLQTARELLDAIGERHIAQAIEEAITRLRGPRVVTKVADDEVTADDKE